MILTAGRKRLGRKIASYSLAVMVVITVSAGGWWLYMRYVRLNFHEIVPGLAYRSAQPPPEVLAKWIAHYGIRTVLNLRGRSRKEFYESEKRVVRRTRATLIDLPMSARRLPDVPTMRKLVKVLETARRPLLLHCYYGTDRSGVASVMAAMAIGGVDYAQASQEVSLRTMHVLPRSGITSLLDEYESYCKAEGRKLAGWKQFRHWVTQVYVPGYFNIDIAAPKQVHVRPGRWVSVELAVTNRSGQTIPFADSSLEFRLTTVIGTPDILDSWSTASGPVTFLRWQNLAPGQTRVVRHRLPAMEKPGRYVLRFDILRLGKPRDTSFGRESARLPTCELIVSETTAVNQ